MLTLVVVVVVAAPVPLLLAMALHMHLDSPYAATPQIRTHLENKMKSRTEITRHRVAIVEAKKQIAERQRCIENEEWQLLLYQQREDTALFKAMVAEVQIGANFGSGDAEEGEEEAKELVEGKVVEMHPIALLSEQAVREPSISVSVSVSVSVWL